MAVTIIDDFNSYSNGNLNGQGGWSGDTSYQVQGSTIYEGAKSISNASGTNDVLIAKSIGAYTSGIVGFAFRIDFSGIFAAAVFLRSSGTNICGFDFYRQGGPGAINLQVIGVGTTTVQSSLTLTTWYYGEIELDQANSRVRARLNGGSWTSWVTKSFTSINEIILTKASNGDTASSYYDYITYESPSVVFTISETLALTESISNLRTRLFSTSETITLTETISVLKGIAFNIAEALGLVETFTSTRTRLFTVAESMGLVELAVSFRLKWNAVTKSATATMNNVSKSVSNWINTTKN